RWKGSALIVSERDIAAVAESAQAKLEAAVADAPAEALVRELGEALDRLEQLLAVTGEGVRAAAAPPEPRPDAAPLREAVAVDTRSELWEAFQIEANELLEGMENEVLA